MGSTINAIKGFQFGNKIGCKINKIINGSSAFIINNQGFFSANTMSTNSLVTLKHIGKDALINANNFSNYAILSELVIFGEGQISGCSFSSLSSGLFILKDTLSFCIFENLSQVLNVDLTYATIIFGNYGKRIFSRQDGTAHLSYYDNTDTLQIVDVNA